MSLLVVGTVALDTIETPFGRVDRVLGGSGSYASLAASRFTPTRLVTIVGRDFPDSLRTRFSDRGICLKGMVTHPSLKTQFWHGRYHTDMNQRDHLDVDLDIIEAFDATVPPGYIESPIVLLAHNRPQTQLRALEQLTAPTLVIADTIDYWIQTQRPTLMRVIERVNILMVNDQEARLLAETSDLFRAADRILAMGPTWVIIKKGEHGGILIGPETCIALPAYPSRSVIDPTGAGDTFAGALVGSLIASGVNHPMQMRRSMAMGIVLASFTVEGFGMDRLSAVSDAEFDERFQAYCAMLRL